LTYGQKTFWDETVLFWHDCMSLMHVCVYYRPNHNVKTSVMWYLN